MTTKPTDHRLRHGAENSSTWLVALGLDGVLVGTPDGRWTPYAVGRYVHTDFSLLGQTRLLLTTPSFLAVLCWETRSVDNWSRSDPVATPAGRLLFVHGKLLPRFGDAYRRRRVRNSSLGAGLTLNISTNGHIGYIGRNARIQHVHQNLLPRNHSEYVTMEHSFSGFL